MGFFIDSVKLVRANILFCSVNLLFLEIFLKWCVIAGAIAPRIWCLNSPNFNFREYSLHRIRVPIYTLCIKLLDWFEMGFNEIRRAARCPRGLSLRCPCLSTPKQM